MMLRSLPLRFVSALALGLVLTACDEDDGDSGGDTGDDHGHSHDTDDGHGSGDETAHAEDTAAGSPAEAYCDCVFEACHEPYHAKWGEDEIASRAACIAEAEALPVNGSDIEMGNFYECRMHFCAQAAADESLCPNALGDAVCM